MFPLEIEQKYTYNQRKRYLRTYKIASPIAELAILFYDESQWLFAGHIYSSQSMMVSSGLRETLPSSRQQ